MGWLEINGLPAFEEIPATLEEMTQILYEEQIIKAMKDDLKRNRYEENKQQVNK